MLSIWLSSGMKRWCIERIQRRHRIALADPARRAAGEDCMVHGGLRMFVPSLYFNRACFSSGNAKSSNNGSPDVQGKPFPAAPDGQEDAASGILTVAASIADKHPCRHSRRSRPADQSRVVRTELTGSVSALIKSDTQIYKVISDMNFE
ncbi:hypothetical protein NKJ06_18690 [Mesorhizobium sp. M0293]|uniref:hypothetical protein n=1 Tax=unclassified Mesorhizobium TaxID=325217 RepID=UPI00333B43D9